MKRTFLDEEIVEQDRNSLYIGNLNTVEFDLLLPKKGEYGSEIIWQSGHERYLSNEGKITRPTYGMGDRIVPLCATFRYGSAEAKKTYEVRILEERDKLQIYKIYPVKIEVEIGKKTDLPQATIVETKDKDIISHLVSWNRGGNVTCEKPGLYHEEGLLSGTDYSVMAEITAVNRVEEEFKSTRPCVRECKKAEIVLTQGSAFYESQENMLKFLLSVNDDQMLYNFRQASGLDIKGAPPMYGWDAPDSQLKGHTTGHYLSALALCYQATANARIKEKAVYMVKALHECQETFARQTDAKEGFLSGYSEEQFDLLEQYTTYPTIWAPYYTLHKILAGLLDCYRLLQLEEALEIADSLGMWVWNRLSRLPHDQLSRMWGMYIAGEFGGMNDVMAELFMITGKEEFLRCARLFYNDKLFYPLEREIDALSTMHANQHIPQVLGAMKIFKATGEKRCYELSKFFWETVTAYHSYANGGTGEGEMFHEREKIGALLNKDTVETCASYNMLKLTKELYQYLPDVSYMDYYERTLLNHILVTQDEKVTGESTYFLPLGPGMKREFLFENSCCHGTGMESRFKYREGIYFYDECGNIYVNLFIPSQMWWEEQNLFIKQEADCRYPWKTKIYIKGSGLNTIKIRRPWWVGQYTIIKDGEKEDLSPDVKGYFQISGDFSRGVMVDLEFPYRFHLIRTPDEPEKAAVYFGPYMMAVLSEEKEFIRFSFDQSNISEKMIHTENPLKFKCEGYTFVPLCDVKAEAYHAYIICRI